MSEPGIPALSSPDVDRLAEVARLAGRADAIDDLIARLGDPSWPVRRAVVAALGQKGQAAVDPLVASLVSDRSDERRLAATVDALVASVGEPESALVALGGTDAAVVCDAAQILGRRRRHAGVAALIAWTAHPDDNVAVSAMEALGRIGGGVGLEALAVASRSASIFRVFGSIEVLARVEDPGALAPLVALLADTVAGIEATRALGRRGLPDAVPALIPLLDSRSGGRARAAATALVAIAEQQAARFRTSDAVTRAVRAAVVDPGATTRHIARAVTEGEAEERAAIASVIGWLGDPSGAAVLIELLADEPRVARAASAALGELGEMVGDANRELLAALRARDSATRAMLLAAIAPHPDVSEAVAACLDDASPDVRKLACELLARAHAIDAVPALFQTLDDSDPRVVQAATAAIQALGHDHTEALALTAARSASRQVRRAALRLLGYFGWPSGVEPLLEAVAGDDERLRETALHSLAFIDDPRALTALLDAAVSLGAPGRGAAMRALGHTTAAPAVVDRLAFGLADPDAWVRYYACQSIGRLRAAGFVDALVACLRDPAGQVRIAGIDALARIPEPGGVQALLDAVVDPDPELRRAALLGLGTACPPSGLAPVLAAAQASDATTRVIALSALAGFEGPEVDATLAAAAREEDDAVRTTAVGVLASRPGFGASAALIGLIATPVLNEMIVESLANSVPGRIPAVLFALEQADAATASALVAALARMDRPDARAALGVALVMDQVASRRAAAAALAAIGAGTARLQLERAVASDADAEVRRVARQALASP